MTSALAAHLWQSTLFLGAAWLLTLALRRNRAHVRYWVWLTASVKFLVPFSLLVGLGNLAPRHEAAAPIRTAWLAAAEQIGQPLIAPPTGALRAAAAANRAHGSYLAAAAVALWACGFAAVALCWLARWKRVQVLRRSARILSAPKFAATVMSAPGHIEPGVCGLFRPVLLLPEGIEQRLDAAQLDAILAHELCHVYRHDNLTAAVHMVAQAIFWFHPSVWWLGARLVDERERACDEEVLRLGCHPRVYAEGILNVCKLYLESPLQCVPGVTGSNLKRRIEAIVSNRATLRLNFARKVALALAAVAALAAPIAVGILHAPAIRAQSTPAAAKFDVASVKRNAKGGIAPTDIMALGLTKSMAQGSRGARFSIDNVSLNWLIQMAYNVKDFQVVGGPSWAKSDGYDIAAKAEGNASFEQMRPMLQTLLADRFQLTLRRENREFPVYELAVAKGGLKIAAAQPGSCVAFDPASPPPFGSKICGGSTRKILSGAPERRDRIEASGIAMARLVEMISDEVGRTVIDKTGFTGTFNLQLDFAPDEGIVSGLGPSPIANPSGPSIFTALQEQLGLRLESAKGPVPVLVMAHAERPSEN
jgi:uncharacterized protein (TIGR03435 family)